MKIKHYCGEHLTVTSEQIGQEIPCPGCANTMRVPGLWWQCRGCEKDFRCLTLVRDFTQFSCPVCKHVNHIPQPRVASEYDKWIEEEKAKQRNFKRSQEKMRRQSRQQRRVQEKAARSDAKRRGQKEPSQSGAPRVSAEAIVALVFGVVAFPSAFIHLWLGMVFGIVGMVAALYFFATSRGKLWGKGLATTGLVCSLLVVAFGVLVIWGAAIDGIRMNKERKIVSALRDIAKAQLFFYYKNQGNYGTIQQLAAEGLLEGELARSIRSGEPYGDYRIVQLTSGETEERKRWGFQVAAVPIGAQDKEVPMFLVTQSCYSLKTMTFRSIYVRYGGEPPTKLINDSDLFSGMDWFVSSPRDWHVF